MTIKYRNSGLYGNSSNDSFYKAHEIDFGIDTSDENFSNKINDAGKEVEYDTDLLREHYKDELERMNSDEQEKWIKDKFWEALGTSTEYLEPKEIRAGWAKIAKELGLTPFTYQGKNLLACGTGFTDVRPLFDALQLKMNDSLDKQSKFCVPAPRRDDVYLKGLVGESTLNEILEKVSELNKNLEIDKNKDKDKKEYEHEDEYER
jgi:hypothetical protein